MMDQNQKLPFLLKAGYGIGDIGCNIFIVTSGLFLLFFLTNIMGVEPAVAGLALLLPKLWDVVSDPIMGGISDITRSRMGRRRPYLLGASIPFGIIFFILFVAPDYTSDFSKAIHVGILFAMGCTAFTVFNVPYSSMVAEMTESYNERISITSFRMISASIGVLLAGGLAMPLVELGGGGEAGFRFMGIIFGAAITTFCLICFRATKSARTLPASKKMPSIGEQVKIAFQNTPFKMLIAMYFLQSLAMGVLMAGLIYYIKYVMHLPETAMGIVFPILTVTAIICIPLWVKIGVKFGKIKSYTVGLSILSIMLFSLFFTQSNQLHMFYFQIFLMGIGFSSFQLFPFSMLPDTVEFDELQSGMRREGIFSGIWASGQKTAYAVGPGIVGVALSLSGFKADAVQPEAVETGIRVVFCIFTSLMLLISLIPFAKYDLTEEKFETIKQMIRQKGTTST